MKNEMNIMRVDFYAVKSVKYNKSSQPLCCDQEESVSKNTDLLSSPLGYPSLIEGRSWNIEGGKKSNKLGATQENPKYKIDQWDFEFIEWLRGFVDGEGNFSIAHDHNTYVFLFKIKLHIDDLNLLHFIKSTLNMGHVRTYSSEGVFWISKQEEVQAIIDIFTSHPLNTTKHLNFVAWAKGFNLLQKYKINKDPKLLDAIANLKASMNRLRLDFTLPSNHSVNITPQWFMGFFEGEGSLFVFKKDYTLGISIAQALIDEYAMVKLAEYLNRLPDSNLVKSYLTGASAEKGVLSPATLEGNKPVKIYRANKSEGHSRGKIELVITQVGFIKSVMVPFFDSQPWHGKKYLDFLDFKNILSLKEKGHHFYKEGKDLINLILSQMNNNRLSTSDNPIFDKEELNLKVQTFLNKPSNLELREGRMWIVSDNRFQSEGGKSKALELRDDQGNLVKIFKSIAECGRYLSVSPTTVNKLIKEGKLFTHENENVMIKYHGGP